jgi:hypothetical protein
MYKIARPPPETLKPLLVDSRENLCSMKPWLIIAWVAVSLTSLLTALALGSLNGSPKAKSYSQAFKYVPCDIVLPLLPTKLPID